MDTSRTDEARRALSSRSSSARSGSVPQRRRSHRGVATPGDSPVAACHRGVRAHRGLPLRTGCSRLRIGLLAVALKAHNDAGSGADVVANRPFAPRRLCWRFWRGTPEHIAQIARVASESVGKPARCDISIEVPPYQQTFEWTDFARAVTGEALRDFRCIWIRALGPDLRITVAFRRKSPFMRTGKNTAEIRWRSLVILRVRPVGSSDPDPRVMRRMEVAIDRGRVRLGGWGDLAVVIFRFLGPLYVALGVLYWFLIAPPDWPRTKWAVERPDLVPLALVVLVGLIIPLMVAFVIWVRPFVEVAPHGGSRLWLVIRRAGPWVAGIIAAGIVKLTFG